MKQCNKEKNAAKSSCYKGMIELVRKGGENRRNIYIYEIT